MTDSPVVRLNHAAAIAMADGPQAGLAVINGLEGLDAYHLFHATRGELLLRANESGGAGKAFRQPRPLTVNPAEQRHLDGSQSRAQRA